jgi:hypothetical protein
MELINATAGTHPVATHNVGTCDVATCSVATHNVDRNEGVARPEATRTEDFGGVITTGIKGDFEFPFAATINSWTLVADQTGSIVIDVWKDTYTNFPPLVGDSIAGTEKPTLSSVNKNQDLSLTTWTTSITSGDIIRLNVDSATTVTRVTLSIKYTKV